jgi:hypothetical protein
MIYSFWSVAAVPPESTSTFDVTFWLTARRISSSSALPICAAASAMI